MSGNPERNPWRFRSPVTVTRVRRGGPADGVLSAGDRITAIEGAAMTSEGGARMLATLLAGKAVALTVERNGSLRAVRVTPIAACPDDPWLIGNRAPGVSSTEQRLATMEGTRTPAPPAPRATNARGPSGSVSVPPPLELPAWLGFALACNGCGWAQERDDATPYWESTAPPRVYGVQPGSPADLAGVRIGDLLVRVNGASITERAGGRALGAVQPGEELRLLVRRDGTERELRVRAGSLAQRDRARAAQRYLGTVGSAEVTVSGTDAPDVAISADRRTMTISVGGSVIQVRVP